MAELRVDTAELAVVLIFPLARLAHLQAKLWEKKTRIAEDLNTFY